MKTINIGPYDGDQVQIQVEDNATINDALRTAGLTLARSQSVTSYSDAENLDLGSSVQDGETYLITGNQSSGFSFFL